MSTRYVTPAPVTWADVLEYANDHGWTLASDSEHQKDGARVTDGENSVWVYHDPADRYGHAFIVRYGANDPGEMVDGCYDEEDYEFWEILEPRMMDHGSDKEGEVWEPVSPPF